MYDQLVEFRDQCLFLVVTIVKQSLWDELDETKDTSKRLHIFYSETLTIDLVTRKSLLEMGGE